MERKNQGITLIALIITIIIMLILAGIVLSLTLGEYGIIKKAQTSGLAYEERQAREKLEIVLLDMQTDKVVNNKYNQDNYLTSKIEENGMIVNGNIVLVDGWQFQIDRNVPKIGESLGKNETIVITTPYVGTTSFTTNISYINNETEIKSYIYVIDNIEIPEIQNKEYTKEEIEPETTHTIKVIAQYKDGSVIESNILTIKTKPRTYLYNNGDQCIEITGGWEARAVGCGNAARVITPTIYMNSSLGCMEISATKAGEGMAAGSAMIKNTIDYSKYRYLKVVYTAYCANYNGNSVINIYKNHENESIYDLLPPHMCYEQIVSTKKKFTVDISQIDDFNNFYFYLQTAENKTTCLSLYEVWLEE